jgi:opacity protein-like surface antigen|tara:strand:- start:371 stop:802 length:432 start_codon:yes stop_codon:yes gene_type:complete
MTKLFLTMTLALSTMVASAQYSAITTITSVEDEAGESTYNVTDKIGVGYQVSEKLIVGVTMDGEDKYELLGRYSLMNGVWGTCVYKDHWGSDVELIDRINLGLGYSFKVWNNLYVDPNYTMPAKADANGDREGTLNLGVSYKF